MRISARQPKKSNFQKDSGIQQDGRKARHRPSSPLVNRRRRRGPARSVWEPGSGRKKASEPLQVREVIRHRPRGRARGRGSPRLRAHVCHPRPRPTAGSSSVSLEETNCPSPPGTASRGPSCPPLRGRRGPGRTMAAPLSSAVGPGAAGLPGPSGVPAAGKAVQPHIFLLDVLVTGLVGKRRG